MDSQRARSLLGSRREQSLLAGDHADMTKHKTTAKPPRAARLTRRALAAVIGGTGGTIIVQNGVDGSGGIAAPPIGADAIVGGGK
jgi:hypothetical protein